GQGGLGLPDRDYYFKEDEKSQNIRAQYKEYIASMLSIHRLSPVNADGSQNQTKYPEIIFNIESNLARVCMTRVERRDMEKQYNKKSISELKSLTPSIDWDVYFNEIGITQKNITNIVVQQPDFFLHINQAFKDVSIDDWKVYLEWKVVNATSGYLNSKLSSRSFDFYGKLLTGTKEQKPRWKRVVSTANSMIGELVAQEYVKVAFSEDSKRRINEMVDNLRDAFRGRIEKLEWMSPETKTKAIEKLQSFNRKLGYPDKWKDYTELRLTPESYLQLYYTSSEFEHIKMIDKLGKPIDKSEWEMLPQTVNAYYNPVNNEIVFPAAIMQPPFFNPLADDAVNYGAIGAVIGHEFSHGFDDQGSKFDSHGNMNNWWSDNDKQKFEAKTKILADQYNKFSVEDKVFVNGQLTLGENIADFAGLTVSYDAYQRSLKGKSKVNIDGFTPEQRFFIGFAQVWKNNSRPEYLRQQVMTDPHSPGRFRVLGPLSNMPEYYSAFGVKSGDKMYIDEKSRAKIW
ncbi:MAG: M13 family metallopeptidase, partial [Bacteroidota bacterium]